MLLYDPIITYIWDPSTNPTTLLFHNDWVLKLENTLCSFGSCHYWFNLSGIIITSGDFPSSTEVLELDLSPSSCSLPPLTGRRDDGHTQTGLTACGGSWNEAASKRSCVTLSGGIWNVSHTLVHERYGHCAWETDSGIILLGGYSSPKSSEILKEDGGSVELFTLKYNTL